MSKILDKIISIRNPKSPISESYRGIRTSIEFSNLDEEMKVINVTSSMQHEGKSTVIANLAVSFANLEKKVCYYLLCIIPVLMKKWKICDY